jgi:Protein of unknown function (DUF3891)
MFRMMSDRGLIVPQHEHARVSGVIAALWGNDRFQPAPLPAASFLAGVDQHDRAYGLFDTDELLAMGAERWCAVTRRGLGRQTDDPVLDLVVNLHLRRLTDASAGPLEAALAADLEAEIAAQQAACDREPWRFEHADAITDLCDRISFALSFDAHTRGAVSVHPAAASEEVVEVHFEVRPGGSVSIDPWPLSVAGFEGAFLAFAEDRYPDLLRPSVRRYRIEPGQGG